MKIPNTGRKKALLIVDVQDSFIIDRNKYIISNIKKIIENIDYDMIVYSIQYNKKDSLRYKQVDWCEESNDTDTIPELLEVLNNKNNVFKVNKLTRSIWKCDEDLIWLLKRNYIEEIHLVWFLSNDCIIASAYESFDLGYYTFVIEEAVETRTTSSNNTKALDILNYLNLTNNSKFVGWEKVKYFNL